MNSQAQQILSRRTADELKADYREARRCELAGNADANEARRLITIALMRKVGREATARFERTGR